MNICINIHNNPRNVHKNEKSSRHLDKKWYHGVRVKRSKSRSCLHDKAVEFVHPLKHEEVAICVANQRIPNVFRIA